MGAHIAARLAEAGYDLALHAGHDPTPEPWLGDALKGVSFASYVGDLSQPSTPHDLLDDVERHFGRPVSLLVNNASRFAAFEGAVSFDAIVEHHAVNVAAPVALAVAMAERLGDAPGAVINLLDQRIANPPADQLAYTLSKQALAEATRTLAVALAPRVRVNGVAPGLTIPTADYSEAQLARLATMMPLGRLPHPDEIADAVAWLAGSTSVTGQVIFVDAGAHLRSFDRDFVNLGR
jgi:pteridine reductase